MAVPLNLNYIRAAILSQTGRRLRLREVANYLVELGMVSRDKANQALYFNYEGYHPPESEVWVKPVEKPLPVTEELDKWTPIEKDEYVHDDD